MKVTFLHLQSVRLAIPAKVVMGTLGISPFILTLSSSVGARMEPREEQSARREGYGHLEKRNTFFFSRITVLWVWDRRLLKTFWPLYERRTKLAIINHLTSWYLIFFILASMTQQLREYSTYYRQNQPTWKQDCLRYFFSFFAKNKSHAFPKMGTVYYVGTNLIWPLI